MERTMLRFFVLGTILAFWTPIADASYMCTGLNIWWNATYVNTTQTLFHYETDVLYAGNPAGYETLTIANSKLFTYNSSFYALGLQQDSYPQQEAFNCANVTGNCTMIFADGNGDLSLGVSLNGAQDYLLIADVAYFRGTIFWEIGLVLSPDDGCVEVIDIDFRFPNYTTYGEYCCNRWETLPEAPPVDNTCLGFTSNVEFYNASMSLANLTFAYDFNAGKNITVRGQNFTSFLPFLQYDHNINYAFETCQGSTDNPQSVCVAPIEFTDAVYAFYVDIVGYTDATWHAIAGAVEFRYGQLMRNGSDPFTPQNSCFSYTFDSSMGGTRAFDSAILSRSQLCCTSWQNPVSTITPMTTPSSSRVTYGINIIIANSTNFGHDGMATLNATLQITNSNYVFTVTSYSSLFTNSNYHVYTFANQFLTEDCLGSSPQTCNLAQNDGQSYPWFISTSFAPDGFRLFTTVAQNGQLTIPELGPNERCYYVVNPYNYAYPPLYVQATICISK